MTGRGWPKEGKKGEKLRDRTGFKKMGHWPGEALITRGACRRR